MTGAPVLPDVFDSRGGITTIPSSITTLDQEVQQGGVALTVQSGAGAPWTFKSVTAYRQDESDAPIDFDSLPDDHFDVPAVYENKQFSQEVQLLLERGRLNGLVGAYYLDADARTAFDVRAYTTGLALPPPFGPLPGLTLGTDSRIGTKTWAVFGDFTYDINQQFSLSVGGRYTSDRRKGDIVRKTYILGGSPIFGGAAPFDVGIAVLTTSDFHRKRKDTAFTPRASLSFKPDENNNIYLSYSRGFKGGGFDPRGQTSQAPVQTPEGIFDYMAFDP